MSGRKTYTRQGPRKTAFDPEKHCGATANDGLPCTNIKGYGTDHKGMGRCKFHAGRKIKHGIYSTIRNERLKAIVERLREEVEDPMDLLPEVEMIRALAVDFIERYNENKDALLSFHRSFEPILLTLCEADNLEAIQSGVVVLRELMRNERPRQILDVADASAILDRVGRMVERIAAIEAKKSLSPEKVAEYRDAMVMLVMKHCPPEIAKELSEDLRKL